jgi:hypothetical protein
MLLITGLIIAGTQAFAQQQGGDVKEYILIVRYQTDAPMPDADLIKVNGQHWAEFIAALAKSGKLVTALRPQQTGRTISGKEMAVKEGTYIGNKAVVSSLFVVKSGSIDEATEIARKCPIYELGGSVEIREVMNTAN